MARRAEVEGPDILKIVRVVAGDPPTRDDRLAEKRRELAIESKAKRRPAEDRLRPGTGGPVCRGPRITAMVLLTFPAAGLPRQIRGAV